MLRLLHKLLYSVDVSFPGRCLSVLLYFRWCYGVVGVLSLPALGRSRGPPEPMDIPHTVGTSFFLFFVRMPLSRSLMTSYIITKLLTFVPTVYGVKCFKQGLSSCQCPYIFLFYFWTLLYSHTHTNTRPYTHSYNPITLSFRSSRTHFLSNVSLFFGKTLFLWYKL